jgi:hypothetical protein
VKRINVLTILIFLVVLSALLAKAQHLGFSSGGI